MLIVVFICACAAALLLTPVVLRVARRLHLYDHPGERRVHTSPIPRLGGIAVCLATFVGFACAAVVSPSTARAHFTLLVGIVLGGVVMFGAGLWDDVRGLSPRGKLLAQLVAASIVCLLGFRIDALTLGGSPHMVAGVVGVPLTILWIVGITNAFNLIDGLDGLATGVAIVALGTTLATALVLGRDDVALVAAALLGALFGFLRYNFNPARIFLGDSGSLFIGFMLAVLSVRGSTKSSTAVLAIVPLFALALPLLDTLLAMARRWLRGSPFSTADGRHIHHRLLALGLTPRRATALLYVVAAALASVALMIALAPPEQVLLITAGGGAVSLVLLMVGLKGLKYHEFSEAGTLIAVAPAKMRRILRDRIEARDLAQLVAVAESRVALNAILEDHAPLFGFMHMELCAPAAITQRALLRDIDFAQAWWAVFPLGRRAAAAEALVIWCPTFESSRPHGTERVARILTPALIEWLDREHTLAVYPLPELDAVLV
jgi:UDP-GlcNAc:undecaprenyl-phosphate GlcNAc-1-phosphate transferase